ncbi:MAG: class I SAM-dependent methyltransferase [Candidatus Omnitrophica bacterium]|nr:class I SAM-dependent methyltransferase [Candidatus Omnitrophota bacterium]
MLETLIIPENVRREHVTCDLCGSDKLEEWDRARTNNLSRCRQCALIFTNPRIAEWQEKDRIVYAKDYFQQKSRMTHKLVRARTRVFKSEIRAIKQYIPQGRILDVGCGTGAFLSSFGNNWDKYGCDTSSYALDIAKQKGIKIFHDEFENLDFDNSQFDVICFRASLHHTYSPQLCLKKAYTLLKSNGLIVISMSNNVDSVCGRLFKAHIKSYEQAHNYLFSKNTLIAYLTMAGFKIEKIKHPYFGTGYESVKDFLSIVPLYLKYCYLKKKMRLNQPDTYNFKSPTFYGNYISVYAQK